MPEIKQTFELLKDYLNDFPFGLLLFNNEKKLVSWNKEVLNIFGTTNEDIGNNNFGNVSSQILEIVKKEDIDEGELIGLLKPYKVVKVISTDKNTILIITEAYQEAIGEMSHELRRPITNIKTLAESLLMGAKDDPDISQRFLENINNEIDRLSRLVNDLLNISKIRSGRLELTKKKINLKLKAEDAIKLLTPIAEKKKTKLHNEVQTEYEIYADNEQIDHVIQNLIENAIKYSPDESKISVKSGPVLGSFEIEDNGIGIAPEHLSKIFERFYRIDRTKAKGSSGLGLSIVKNIIDLHGGKIEVKSTLGQGSSFIVYLPLE